MPDESLELQLGHLLLARNYWIATAESCTGGLITHRLTNISGCSAYVVGGVVAYSNSVKMQLLNVPETTLNTHGAVSQPTAEAMVTGALTLFDADIAISVTGIAGPGGGSEDKPVGLTYIGCGVRDGRVRVERHIWPGDRLAVKSASADAALRLAIAVLREA